MSSESFSWDQVAGGCCRPQAPWERCVTASRHTAEASEEVSPCGNSRKPEGFLHGTSRSSKLPLACRAHHAKASFLLLDLIWCNHRSFYRWLVGSTASSLLQLIYPMYLANYWSCFGINVKVRNSGIWISKVFRRRGCQASLLYKFLCNAISFIRKEAWNRGYDRVVVHAPHECPLSWKGAFLPNRDHQNPIF